MNLQTIHLRTGQLVALAENQPKSPGLEIPQHLEQCPACSNLYNFLTNYFKQRSNGASSQALLTQCPRTDMDKLAFFLQFMSSTGREKDKLALLMHLNDCYKCYEWFANNWTIYLDTLKKLGIK